MSLALLRPRVEALVSAGRVRITLTRERLVAEILAARPGSLDLVDVDACTLDELLALATAAERERAERLDVARHLRDAVLVYSRRRPLETVADLVGTGTWWIPLPDGWDAGFSAIRTVEYPVGRRPPELLGKRAWWIYEVPEVGQTLAFYDETPSAGAAVRVRYTAPHRIDEETTTVPAAAFDTIVKLAAGSACQELAAFYSHDNDSSLQLDGVRHGSKGSEFDKRGRAFRAEAEAELPELESGRPGPAGAEVSFAGEIPFLTHY